MDNDIAGRYRLEERIGSGGMAEVWRAIDGRTGATVAVKRLHPGVADDPAARARFRREIEAARAVAHPAAVRVLDAGIDDDAPWLVMEHVAGGSLADRLQAGAELPLAEGALIGADVAGALSALHAAGIVHRDVTPSNILLPSDGGARLGDFGIARTWDGSALEDVTLTGDLVGTLRFVAPEVLAGQPAASRRGRLGARGRAVRGGDRPPTVRRIVARRVARLAAHPAADGRRRPGARAAPRPDARPGPHGPAGGDRRGIRAGAASPARRCGRRRCHPGGGDGRHGDGRAVAGRGRRRRAGGNRVDPACGSRAAIRAATDSCRITRGAARDPASIRRIAATRGMRLPAPAVLAVGLVLLAAVVLGATAFGRPATGEDASPPAITVDATPAPTVTAAPEEPGGNAGGGRQGQGQGQGQRERATGRRGNGNGNGD